MRFWQGRKRVVNSITKRWVRGSLLFTLIVVLVAEAVFLYSTIAGYYDGVARAIQTQFYNINSQLAVPANATEDERSQRLIRAVEQFEEKTRFEFMLIAADGSIITTSSGVHPTAQPLAEDIRTALAAGSDGTGRFTGKNAGGERVMAITVHTPYTARGVVAMRLVTSLVLVDKAVRNVTYISVLVLAAIILASVVSGVYFIRSIVIPVQKIEATASRIAQGDFDTRIEAATHDEIGDLCQTINNMAEELSHAEQLKNDFISSVSHELRTPLTSIKGWADTIRRLPDPADPNFQRGLDVITGETDRLYDMVEELLDFSRMQSGLRLSLELLDLAAEVEEAVLLSTQRAAALDIALDYAVPDYPVPVVADKNRIRQVMVNVLDNAIKYSNAGGHVDVGLQVAGTAVDIVVKDEGQGISPEDLENVRQKFYKGRGAVRGSGIGLAVVDEIMLAHDGALDIDSTQGEGTTVTLRLPLYKKVKPNQPKEKQDAS